MKIQTFSILSGTTVCNAACPYCISKMTPSQGMGLTSAKIDWIKFNKACRLAQINNVSTVLITGKGEPLLCPEQITDFLRNMKKYEFPLIELQSNALVLGRQWKKYEPLLKKWRNLGLNTIAISLVHYEKEKNKEIYTPNSDYIDIEKTIKNLHKLGYSVRISCIMLKGFIDSVKEMKKLVEWAKKIEVEQLTMRSVAVPKKSQNNKVYDWTSKKVLTRGVLVDINEFLEKNANKLMTLDNGGVVYDLDGQNVCLTDCLTISPNTEELRQLIFFPDGHLRYDWQYPGAILM